MNELTVIECTDLEQHESVIEQGLKTFVEVGTALLAIRDGKLYRQAHGTFEDYCATRWGMTDRYARNLMSAAEVVGNLKTGTIVPVLPATESQVRPLARLDPIEQPIVWQRVVDTAHNGKITAAHVESTVKEYKYEQQAGDNHRFVPSVTTDEYEQLADDLAGDEDGYDWTEEEAEEVTPDYASTIVEESEPKTIKMSIHYSSATPEHYTPEHILSLVSDVMGTIDLDPCSNSKEEPNVPAIEHYTIDDDGLSLTWKGSVFMNPPYGREIGGWIEKLCAEYESGNVTEAIALVPARVDTAWWNKLTATERTYAVVCFVRGRLTFINNEDPAPFPSALVYLGDNRCKFYAEFSTIGQIWSQWNDEMAGFVCYG
jgi:hypothetical protein